MAIEVTSSYSSGLLGRVPTTLVYCWFGVELIHHASHEITMTCYSLLYYNIYTGIRPSGKTSTIAIVWIQVQLRTPASAVGGKAELLKHASPVYNSINHDKCHGISGLYYRYTKTLYLSTIYNFPNLCQAFTPGTVYMLYSPFVVTIVQIELIKHGML